MSTWLKRLSWLPGLVLITGCDVFFPSSNSGTPDLVSPADNEPITLINDPLFSHQWYLSNPGSYALTPATVATQAGEDMTALAAGVSNQTTNPLDYAQSFTGQGVVVSVVDTGLEIAHEDLQPNVQINGSFNFGYPLNGRGQFDPTFTPYPGEDVTMWDHGTSVAGLVGARGGNGIGMWGVAPGVQLKGFNFIEYQNTINDELFSLGKQTDSEPIPNQNIDIFNMSYGANPVIGGLTEYERILLEHIEYGATNYRDTKGSIYVKAAGNEYFGGNVFTSGWCAAAIQHSVTCYNVNMEPVNTSPFLITVGAFNANGERSSYSNTGSALWVSSPGGEFGDQAPAILTTDRSNCSVGFAKSSSLLEFDSGSFQEANQTLNPQCSYTAIFNGTSSATPIVSGVAALLLQANPDLTAREVKHIMAIAARQIQPSLSDTNLVLADGTVVLDQGWVDNAVGRKFSNAFGFGAVDVQAAITEALNKLVITGNYPDETSHQREGFNFDDFSFKAESEDTDIGLNGSISYSSALGVRTTTVNDLTVVNRLESKSGFLNLVRLNDTDAGSKNFAGTVHIKDQGKADLTTTTEITTWDWEDNARPTSGVLEFVGTNTLTVTLTTGSPQMVITP